MNHEGSDYDYFICYVASSKDILLGTKNATKSEFINYDEKDVDESWHEIGTLVDGLIDGNWNYLLGVLAIKIYGGEDYEWLLDFVKNHPAKNFYHAINGMALQNYKKYIVNGKDASPERIKKIVRTIEFGIKYLKDGTIDFRPGIETTPEGILKDLDDLEKAYDSSSLPLSIPEKELKEWMLKIRLKNL
jgi:hypothetical protein